MARPKGAKDTRPRKPGSGRKPELAEKLRREYIADKQNEAERAFAYVADTVEGSVKGDMIRLMAARELMDRVWGKPKQAFKIDDWRSKLIDLLREQKISAEQLTIELGHDLANELIVEARLLPSESG